MTRNITVKSLDPWLLIPLILIITFMGGYIVFQERQLNSSKKLIQQCQPNKSCPGILDALEKLVKAHKNLQFYNLKGASLENASLKRANLSTVDLENAHLHNANLDGANLESVYLYRTNLELASLINANLHNAYLHSTNLTAANLMGANLKWANLYGANLELTNLSTADLKRANFKGANLQFTKLIESQNLLPSQIKLACNWKQALYKGHFDPTTQEWIVDEADNQQYIEQLKLDTDSDPKTPVDCTQWERDENMVFGQFE